MKLTGCYRASPIWNRWLQAKKATLQEWHCKGSPVAKCPNQVNVLSKKANILSVLYLIHDYQILWILYVQGWVFLHHVWLSDVHMLLLHILLIFIIPMSEFFFSPFHFHFLLFFLIQCTVTCGQGLRYRVVLCIDHRGMHTGGCSPKTKPHIKEECVVPTPCYKPKGNEAEWFS